MASKFVGTSSSAEGRGLRIEAATAVHRFSVLKLLGTTVEFSVLKLLGITEFSVLKLSGTTVDFSEKTEPFFAALPPLKYCVISRGRPEGGRGEKNLRV